MTVDVGPPGRVAGAAVRPPHGPMRASAWPALLLALLSIPVAIYGLAFTFAPALNPDFHARLATLGWYGPAHFLGGGIALLIGGFQFVAPLRARYPGVHRWIGRIYLGAVLVGGIGGIGIATIAHGGKAAQVGFGLLAVLWLYSGARAWAAIRAGDIAMHRRWMIRNFALTFGAVTLRIELGLFTGVLGWPFDEAYVAVAWLAWVGNLVVAEWWLLQRESRTPALQSPVASAAALPRSSSGT